LARMPTAFAILTSNRPSDAARVTLAEFNVGVVWQTQDGFADTWDGILSARRRPPLPDELRPAHAPEAVDIEYGRDFRASEGEVEDQLAIPFDISKVIMQYDPLAE
jgi:hypothetical protein